MKMKRLNAIPAFILALLLIAGLFPAVPAAAAGDIYVNDSNSVLTGGLGSAYAIGEGGTSFVSGDAAVMTADGLTTVGGSSGSSGSSTRPGRDEVSPTPEHLSVTGRISLPYSKFRVGLYYYDGTSSIRNSTLESANLENDVGSGYLFGYYDSNRVFHQVGYTAETAITMAMDKNVTISSGASLGCYHILLPGSYMSFEEAANAASQYGGFPAYYNGAYYALYGSYATSAEAQAALSWSGTGGQVYTASQYCVTVCRTTDGTILFEFDCGKDLNLAVSPQSSYEPAVTWFKGYRYHGDFEYVRRSGDKLTVINIVDIEDYVKGVIPYEMSGSWPIEALKAQALCARTYAASHFNANSYYGFDVTNDTYSQVYRGLTGATSTSDAAVEQTAGIYILYAGEPISAMYCSSNGGATEDSENITGNAVGYLRGKVDSFEAAAASINANSSWTDTLTRSQLAEKANTLGFSIASADSIEITYSDTGNVIGMKLTDSNGRSASFSGKVCYEFCTSTLGLKSISFEISENGDSVTFIGSGWGHSLGMSQFGAYAMAKTYGFTYDQIVNFYYTDITLASATYTY